MIVLDANLLLYAYNAASSFQAKALAWLRSISAGEEPIGLPWQTVQAFLRIGTDPRLFPHPLPMERAIQIVEDWMALDQVRLLAPGERHWSALRRMLTEGAVRGGMVTDASLAALTIEHGGVLYTADRDFARFPGLRWVNPLTQG